MPTSGTTEFNLQIDDIIEEAFERCGLQTRKGYDLETARRSLNIMFAEWANRGLNLWKITEGSKTLVASQPSYNFSSNEEQGIIDILSAVVNNGTNDYAVDRISRMSYLDLPKKTETGQPSEWYFERTLVPTLYVYTSPDDTKTYTFKYYALRRIEDAGAYSNTTDLPFRFIPAMVCGLAYYIAMKRAPDRIQLLKQVYEEEFARAAAEDATRASIHLVPAQGYLGGF
ncbi:MAG TPA: hypothetical protein QF698_04365 [Candidatus Marinimicrobia bacterium]|jgi:hypothetical protein|nr:hypothetical protein [Candidatus Neomarinimicrobiota bacterium]|tara:strand:+ start:410 stop:1093 length:684 start_codon:yes stop_codon:yes gene_type:complete